MSNKEKKCSLVFATYNWPEALSLCLESILSQTVLPAEIVIGDDGSKENTKAVIDAFRKKTTIPVKHVWHKDDGYRKTIIMNEALRQTTNDYIVHTDGDMILHPKFIEEHLEARAPGTFIRGSRAMISKATTENLLAHKSINVNFFSKGIENRMNSVRSPLLSSIHHIFKGVNFKYGLLGCNFSFWKKDFVDVNGYNNGIFGWGHEDSELAARMLHNGIAKRTLKFKAICFHLHHAIYARDRESLNVDTRKITIDNKLKYCENGYSKQHEATVWS